MNSNKVTNLGDERLCFVNAAKYFQTVFNFTDGNLAIKTNTPILAPALLFRFNVNAKNKVIFYNFLSLHLTSFADIEM